MRHVSWLAGLAGVAVLAGCLLQPDRPRFDDAAIAQACADQAAAVCGLRTSCSVGDYNVRVLYGDDAACLARQALTCSRALHVTDTNGSPTRLETCSQAYPALSCSSFFDGGVPDRCANPGPDPNGTACSVLQQCASSFCRIETGQICGTCEPQPAIGAVCEARTQCGRDLVCAIPSGMTTGMCAVPIADGGTCLTGTAPCVAGESCVGDDPATSTTGTCKPAVRTVGAACDSSRKAMATCDASAGLACTGTTGTCQLIVLADPGQPCGTTGATNAKITTACADSGLCVRPTGTGLGTCVAAVADGDACDDDPTVGPPCLTPAVCVDHTCRVPDPAACY